MRLRVALVCSLIAAGCVQWGAPPAAEVLEASSLPGGELRGAYRLTDALAVLDVRLTAAARDAPAQSGELRSQTRLVRDHWVLEATIAARSPHRVELEWDGVPRGALDAGPRTRVLAFDLGPAIETSSLYVLRATAR